MMSKLINVTEVRKEIMRRMDAPDGANFTRKRIWADCSEDPPLYKQVSPAIYDEINSEVALIIQRIAKRNQAGRTGVTVQ
jgi:hypothetical protein